MLTEGEARVAVNLFFEPPQEEGTDADAVAPVTSSLYLTNQTGRFDDAEHYREQLLLWHALASCPGFSAADNPAFWIKLLRRDYNRCTHVTDVVFDSAQFFSDPSLHAFPSLTIHLDAVAGRKKRFYPTFYYLRQLTGVKIRWTNQTLVAKLRRIQCEMDPVVAARPIPIHVKFHLLASSKRYAEKLDVSLFFTYRHEYLVEENSAPQMVFTSKTDTTGINFALIPRFELQFSPSPSLAFPALKETRSPSFEASSRILGCPTSKSKSSTSLVSTRHGPSPLREFVDIILCSNRVPSPLMARCRMPHSLTLMIPHEVETLELFFGTLPLTQMIEHLTLTGMGGCSAWGWLVFARFHPQAAHSSLRKLTIQPREFMFRPPRLDLFTLASVLRLLSPSDFRATIEGLGYTEMGCDANAASNTSATSEHVPVETLQSPIPTERTSIPLSDVTIDLRVAPKEQAGKALSLGDGSVELSDWIPFLEVFSASLERIRITRRYWDETKRTNCVRVGLSSTDVLVLVRKCSRLEEISVPTRCWTENQLLELFSSDQGLISIELHGDKDDVLQCIRVLRAMKPHERRHLEHLGLRIFSGEFEPNEWCEVESLLLDSPSLAHLYIHAGRTRTIYGDDVRRVKARRSEKLPLAWPKWYRKLYVAFVSVVAHYQQLGDGNPLARVDVMVILHCLRPSVTRFVGIDCQEDNGWVRTIAPESRT